MPHHERDKFLFVHIPKTGGTSVEKALGITEPENFCFYSWDKGQFDFLKKYSPLSSSNKLHYEPQHYTPSILKELIPGYHLYFKFAFVRNPYTRILSEYFWGLGKKLSCYKEFDPIDFHNWCTLFLAEINSSHKEPQSEFVNEDIDFTGKYENLSADFETLKSKLTCFTGNLAKYKDVTLPFLNETGLDKTHLIDHLLPETKFLIHRVYRSDFELFSYDPMLQPESPRP
jgi:hypothetical protein